jgi:xanthine dehydrogenase YagS FAD-binding subunit
MQPFEYASPTTVSQAAALLGSQWGDAEVLAGGTDLLSLMKDYVHSPKRIINIKGIKEMAGVGQSFRRPPHRRPRHHGGYPLERRDSLRLPFPRRGRPWRGQPPDPQHRHRRRRPLPAPPLLVLSPGLRPARHEGRQELSSPMATTATTPSSACGPRTSSAPRVSARPHRSRRQSQTRIRHRQPRSPDAAQFFRRPKSDSEREIDLSRMRSSPKSRCPPPRKNATYEVRQKDALDWPLATASVALTMSGNSVSKRRHRPRPRRAHARGGRLRRRLAGRQVHHAATAAQAAAAAVKAAPNRSAAMPTRSPWPKPPSSARCSKPRG